MLTSAEISCACKGLGTPIEPDDFVDPFGIMLLDIRKAVDSLISSYREHVHVRWQSRPLQVVFTEGTSLNARARKLPAADLVILPVGVIERLSGAALALMTIPSFLPRLGEVTSEPFESGTIADFPSLPMLRVGHSDAPIRCFWPVCQHRRAFAQHLTSIATHFVILHELGHVFGGHLECRKSNANGFTELDFSDSTDEQEIPRRVLESDADMFAAFHESDVSLRPIPADLLKDVFAWRSVSTQDAAFVSFAIAIAVLFRLFDAHSSPNVQDSKLYPHPAVRANLVVSDCIHWCVEAGIVSRTRMLKLVRMSLWEVEKTWIRYRLPGRNGVPTSVWVNEVAQQSNRLFAEYAIHWTQLDRIARIKPMWREHLTVP